MGNCIGAAFAFSHNVKKVSPAEEDQELRASAMVAGKISLGPCSGWEMAPISQLCKEALPLAAVLKSGEVCRVIPQRIQHPRFQPQLDTAKNCNGQKVKIVVNKKQLHLLMTSVVELKLRHIVIQSIGRRGKNWRPSLATIPEL